MNDNRGFTLVELLVAIALVAILAAIVYPRLDTILGEAVLNARAREMVLDLRRTQQAAIISGEDHRFEIHVINRVYTIRPRNPVKPAIKIVNLELPITSVTSNFVEIGGGWRAITYSPTGIPSQTGGVVIFDARGRGRAVEVAVATGRVRIEVRP